MSADSAVEPGASAQPSTTTTPSPQPPAGFAQPQQLPFAMPPFYANPFMSPFMPQGAPAEAPAPSATSQNAANPNMGFFVTPAQYQEIMQQYFQHMMASAAVNAPFPMPMQPLFMRPESQVGAEARLEPPLQASSLREDEKLNSAISVLDITEHEKSPSTELCNGTSTDTPASTSSNKENKPNEDRSTPSKSSESSSKEGSGALAWNKPNLSVKPEQKRKTSLDVDSRTQMLIQKQINEIDRELNRRNQNKNIKQINDEDLAELMADIPTTAANSVPSQAALPYSTPAAARAEEVPSKPSLNQLRDSFNLEGPAVQPPPPAANHFEADAFVTQATNPFVPAQQISFPSTPYSVPAFGQPTSVAPAPQQNGHAPKEPSSIASIAQARLSSFEDEPKGLLQPPPPSSNPVHKRNSTSENGDEPVWVMRESYLRRLQREQVRSRARQVMPDQEAAAAAASSVSDWPSGEKPAEEGSPSHDAAEHEETERLLAETSHPMLRDRKPSHKSSKETLVHEPAVLIEGVLFRARYLGSTQLTCEGRATKAARMAQAQEAVARVKAPEGEEQPSTDIDLFISTEKIMVLNTDLQRISDTDVRQDILMDHALRTISYIADIGDLVVLMARRMGSSNSDEQCNRAEGVRKSAKVVCHVFESDEAAFIAQSIGQAFQVAYVEFLRANGIDDPSYLRQIDYQELLGEELEMFSRKETQKDVIVPKKAGEALGVVVVESGWGSMLPTVVLAHMAPCGPAARSNQLNVGDQIIAINGISLVGLPLSAAQKNIQNAKTATAVRLTVVSTPPVVEVRIRRPDTKYQLGFSVQNGVICSLLRGGIAERGGIRVGHRIIEINHQSVVAVAHDRIVNMLATAVGEIQMKTMPTSMFRLLTGQEVPNYI